MPTNVGRSITLQQQLALELIAAKAGEVAAAMLAEYAREIDPKTVDEFGVQYEAMILGAMTATAATRAGYLTQFAAAAGEPVPTITPKVMSPSAIDVLVDGIVPRGAAYAGMREVSKKLAAKAEPPVALLAGQNLLRDYAESTVTSAADFVDREVLGPNRRVTALRRVAHPTACDRCLAVSGALVFKHAPSLRHPQCKCSFEPVYLSDPDYAARLKRYADNAGDTRTGPAARDRRYRGRLQLEDAAFREDSEWLQDEWTAFLRDEQTRIAGLVKTVPSNTYRDWAVMVSANQAEVGNGLLPVITRD